MNTNTIELLDWNVASSEAQFLLQWIAMGITFLFYLALTAFGLRNFFKYIVKQNNQLKLLYVLAILASGTRLGRYAAMLKEMSDQVQFIYISHNKISMEAANQLMGVTMHEPGVSRLVTVDVNQAAELAGA